MVVLIFQAVAHRPVYRESAGIRIRVQQLSTTTRGNNMINAYSRSRFWLDNV